MLQYRVDLGDDTLWIKDFSGWHPLSFKWRSAKMKPPEDIHLGSTGFETRHIPGIDVAYDVTAYVNKTGRIPSEAQVERWMAYGPDVSEGGLAGRVTKAVEDSLGSPAAAGMAQEEPQLGKEALSDLKKLVIGGSSILFILYGMIQLVIAAGGT